MQALRPKAGHENYPFGGPIKWGQALSLWQRGEKPRSCVTSFSPPVGILGCHTLPHRPGGGQAGRPGLVSLNTYLQGCFPGVVVGILKNPDIAFSLLHPRNSSHSENRPWLLRGTLLDRNDPFLWPRGPAIPEVNKPMGVSRETLAPGSSCQL